MIVDSNDFRKIAQVYASYAVNPWQISAANQCCYCHKRFKYTKTETAQTIEVEDRYNYRRAHTACADSISGG